MTQFEEMIALLKAIADDVRLIAHPETRPEPLVSRIGQNPNGYLPNCGHAGCCNKATHFHRISADGSNAYCEEHIQPYLNPMTGTVARKE